METSIKIAGIIGPALMVVSLSEFLNYHIWQKVEPTVVYLNGLLLFVGGLAIIRAHNHWVFDWTLSITIVGWLSLAMGLYRCFFPAARQPGKTVWTQMMLGILFITGLFQTMEAYFL